MTAEGLTADLRHGNIQSLPFGDETMDFILDRGSITHNTRPSIEATIDGVRRVLKPGGTFFSQMFTTDHRDMKFARDFADGSASDFAGGYFAGIGRTFFASRANLDQLFSSKFEIQSIERESHENALTGHVSAVWNIMMRKTG